MVSVFGHVLRQPDFWMVVLLVLILSERSILLRRSQASQVAREHGDHAWQASARSYRAAGNGFR
jgi:hypothetical protein